MCIPVQSAGIQANSSRFLAAPRSSLQFLAVSLHYGSLAFRPRRHYSPEFQTDFGEIILHEKFCKNFFRIAETDTLDRWLFALASLRTVQKLNQNKISALNGRKSSYSAAVSNGLKIFRAVRSCLQLCLDRKTFKFESFFNQIQILTFDLAVLLFRFTVLTKTIISPAE